MERERERERERHRRPSDDSTSSELFKKQDDADQAFNQYLSECAKMALQCKNYGGYRRLQEAAQRTRSLKYSEASKAERYLDGGVRESTAPAMPRARSTSPTAILRSSKLVSGSSQRQRSTHSKSHGALPRARDGVGSSREMLSSPKPRFKLPSATSTMPDDLPVKSTPAERQRIQLRTPPSDRSQDSFSRDSFTIGMLRKPQRDAFEPESAQALPVLPMHPHASPIHPMTPVQPRKESLTDMDPLAFELYCLRSSKEERALDYIETKMPPSWAATSPPPGFNVGQDASRSPLESAGHPRSEFFAKYSESRNSSKPRRPESPTFAQLTGAMQMGLIPEPLVSHKSPEGTMVLNGYRIGDDYATLLSLRAAHQPDLTAAYLANNRLTGASMVQLMPALSTSKLRLLDLSHNSVGRVGAEALVAHLTAFVSLEELSLENNRLTDAPVVKLAEGARLLTNLKVLVLRSNNISHDGARALGQLVSMKWPSEGVKTGRSPASSPQAMHAAGRSPAARGGASAAAGGAPVTGLVSLDLAWNQITGAGAVALMTGLMESPSIQSVDLSWNTLLSSSSPTQVDSFPALCNMVRNSKSITHLDISNTALQGRHASELAAAFNCNRVIRGLHTLGTGVGVDGKGFIFERPTRMLLRVVTSDRLSRSVADLHTRATSRNRKNKVTTRMLSDRATTFASGISSALDKVSRDGITIEDAAVSMGSDGANAPRIVQLTDQRPGVRKPKWSRSTYECCWICGQWRPLTIRYTPLSSGPMPGTTTQVFVLFSFDDWRVDPMRARPDGVWELHRMVPQQEFQYVFLVNGEIRPAADQPTITRPESAGMVQLQDGSYLQVLSTGSPLVGADRWPISGGGIVNVHPGASEADADATPPIVPRTAAFGALAFADVWRFENSVFGSFKCDTDALLGKAFEADWRRTKMPNFVKDAEQLETLKAVARRNYRTIKSIFKYYCCLTTQDIFSLNWNPFTELCNQIQLVDSNTCQLKDIDTIFIATNVTVGQEDKSDRNPDRALTRYEFLEALVRLSKAKYMTSGVTTSIVDAFTRFLNNHLLAFAQGTLDPDLFRVREVHCEAVDMAFRPYLAMLRAVYAKYSGRDKRPGEAPWMSVAEYMDLLNDGDLFTLDFTERDAKYAFVTSMMTQADEMSSDRHTRMQFVEFLEAIAAIAAKSDTGVHPLADKIPGIMEKLSTTVPSA